jgi:hypothetical protein
MAMHLQTRSIEQFFRRPHPQGWYFKKNKSDHPGGKLNGHCFFFKVVAEILPKNLWRKKVILHDHVVHRGGQPPFASTTSRTQGILCVLAKIGALHL